MTNPLSADLDHILDYTRDLWEQVRSNRIFITGGTGFFGCWLLESFCWANDHLDLHASATVLTRNPALFAHKAPHLAKHSAVHLHTGDVRSFDFPEGNFSHIIHAATEVNGQVKDWNPLLMVDTLVEGTRHTLELARQCGAPKFLLTSSGAVYGKQPANMSHIPENYNGAPDPLDPHSVYGEGKRLAELLCSLYEMQFGIHTIIARCFAFVGPYLPLDGSFAIGNLIHDGFRGRPIKIKGDGTTYRSYLYAADLSIWLWTVLFRGKSCFPYNIGADEAIKITDLANIVADQFTPRPNIEVERRSMNGLSGGRYIPSIERVYNEFGLRPTVTIPDAIQRTTKWHRFLMGR